MGIKDLAKVISDHAPTAIKENDIKNYFGRKIAIDASMSIYQFLIAVRQDGSNLTNESGETTSHLMGMFYRTIRMVDSGIKPLYVFDGKAPQLKATELAKRQTRRDEAEKEHEKAVELGDTEAIDKFSRRLVRVTREHNEECKKLLKLMGIPYVDAPCEAEAQCAALVKAGKVYATATEDMDGLTFGSKVLLRHMTFSEAKKMPIKEFYLERILTDFGMSHEEFVDLCILLGCDYCGSIKGIGPKKAFDLIKQHRSIERVLKAIDTKKYQPPEDWSLEVFDRFFNLLVYYWQSPTQEVRKLFLTPEVLDPKEMEFTWNDPDEEGLLQYMVKEKNFSEDRIRNGAAKLKKGRNSSMQGRIDSFFTVSPAVSQKRKVAEEETKGKLTKKATVKTGVRGKK